MEGDEGAESTTPPTDDDVLREQSFKRPQGLNLDSFMVATSSSDDVATGDGLPRDAGPVSEGADGATLAVEHPHEVNDQHEALTPPAKLPTRMLRWVMSNRSSRWK